MKRLYVLVSKDLEPIYGCVQGGHAVAQWLLDNKETQSWNNNYLIYLSTKNELTLLELIDKLQLNKTRYSYFEEPDLNNRKTAFACYTERSTFKKLKLFK